MHVESYITFEQWVIQYLKLNPNSNKDVKNLKSIYDEELKNFYTEQESYFD